MILMIDNYDSFTYNLVQYIGELGYELKVYRNDQLSTDEIAQMAPTAIVLSPGPCTPSEAGISCDVVRRFAGEIPILGVCLGHQCIGQVFGGRVVRADVLMHGKTSEVYHFRGPLYEGIPSPFVATRYHSLIVDRASLPSCLEVTAETGDKTIMGIRHRELDVEGVQFHPESILTNNGMTLLGNFLRRSTRTASGAKAPLV